MAELRVDRKLWLIVLLVLLTGTLSGSSAVNDARDDAYAEWRALSYREQCVFATAALVSASYALVKLETVSPVLKGIPMDYWLPCGMTNIELVALVNRVYQDPANREIPYVGIILEAKKFGGTNGSDQGW